MSIKRIFSSVILPAAAVVLMSIPSQAAYITGKLDFSGEGVLVNNLGIDWLPQNLPNGSAPPTTTGDFNYQGPARTISFSAIPSLVTLGTIRDLPSGLGSGTVTLSNFLAFNAPYGAGLNGANFILDELYQGNISPANPIVLTQASATQVNASVGGRGRIVDSNGDTTYFSIAFTSQFTNVAGITVADVIAAGTTGNGIASSWSGTLDANVPEPTTVLLVGLSLIGLGSIRRKVA